MSLMMELLLLGLAVAVWAPGTILGKSLRAVLIDLPVRKLEQATPLKVIVGLIVFMGLVAVVVGAPEIVALIGIGDLSFAFDVAVLVMLTSAVTRLKSAAGRTIRPSRTIAARVLARFHRNRGRNRSPRPRKAARPPSTDETGPQWGWAFA